MDLTEFLLARIAEDEARQTEWSGSWHAVNCRSNATGGEEPCCGVPARVLAECESRRQIVEREESRLRTEWRRYSDEHRQSYEDWLRPPRGEVLRLLALPFADHPDYDPSWRP